MADYGYLNARVRGLRTRLLPSGFVDGVLADGSFQAFVNALSQTAYAPDLEAARGATPGPGVSLAAVDRALASNFQTTARSLLRFAEDEARTLLGLLLRRYDVASLKAVARAFHAGKAGEAREDAGAARVDAGEARVDAVDAVMAATHLAGELDTATLRAMAGARDLPAAAQALVVAGHPLAEEFRAAVAQYVREPDLLALELRLDQAHYASVREGAREAGAPEPFREYLALEIDAANLLTAVKLRGRDLDVDASFIPGGRHLTIAQFREVAGGEPGTPLPELRGPLDRLREYEGPLETGLREYALRAARLLTADPLDIGLVTHYLRSKEREIAELRLLARGTYYGVPAPTLRRELGRA
jgi:V/A-type H+/Na+-transporting ATPase subunit C